MKTKLFSDKLFYSKLFKLGIPLAFQSLMLALVAACDSLMLGKTDQNSMSAVSLATQIQFVQNMFLFAITGTAVIFGSQYFGKNNKKALHDIFCITLRYSSVISVVFFIACEVIPEYLMLLFTNEQILIDIGVDYLRIAGWSYLLTGISQCYLTMMKITAHAKVSSTVSSGAVVINIIFNAIFIFGLLGAPKMGVKGAAAATLISRIIEICVCLILSSNREFIKPTVKGFFTRNKVLSKDFLRQLLPLTGSSLLWGIGFTSYTAVMGHMGIAATAANAIASVVRDLMCCMCNGIANAGGILVGNELGKGELKKGKEYGDRLVVISAIIGVFVCAVIIALTPLVIRFVTLEPEATEILKKIMIIMAVYMIARCICTVTINGILAAGGDTFYDIYSLIAVMWCFAVPMSFLGAFVFHWPVLLVYLFTCIDEIVKVPWLIIHFKKYKWVKDLTRSETELI